MGVKHGAIKLKYIFRKKNFDFKHDSYRAREFIVKKLHVGLEVKVTINLYSQ